MNIFGLIFLMLLRTVSLGLGMSKYMLSSIKVLKLKRSFTTSTSSASVFKSLMQASSHSVMIAWNLNEGKPNLWAHLLSRHPISSICTSGKDSGLGRPMAVIFTSVEQAWPLESKMHTIINNVQPALAHHGLYDGHSGEHKHRLAEAAGFKVKVVGLEELYH
ncbi:hypothetical protein U9M48_001257 [Paspalum notatum var. saurae]|uniref:Uncharacterized protein n=1 Tax=Paspalum notatum var. saurae TaxID=547442 RepID=A0AAQ3SCU1_PASNO